MPLRSRGPNIDADANADWRSELKTPDNIDWFAGVWSQRNRARELRIEINGLAIPTPEEPSIDTYYAENVVTGFLEISREHVDFERALLTKMHIEIAGSVPE